MRIQAMSAAATALLVLAAASTAHAQSRVAGVDVSVYQGSIDWGQVHAAGTGFGICRVSDGLHTRDSTFAANWNGMRSHGMIRGVYQFFRPTQDPTAQADLLVNAVGHFGPGDLPPVCDVEVTGGVSGATVVARVRTWCARIRARTGLKPIVYTSPGFWPGGSVDATLWVAHWFVSAPRLPSGWGSYAFWQYNDNGHVAGIHALVDQDWFHGSAAQLRAYANGAPAPTSGGGGSGQPVLTLGSKGAAVSTLQTLLEQKGFNPGAVDGDFGPKTLAAVKAFQSSRHLAVDGVVGPQTWGALKAGGGAAPAPAPNMPTLRLGSRGSAVVTLQKALAAKGHSPGAADGIFGPRTDSAVRAFQRSRGLAVDGIVGPKTWAALR